MALGKEIADECLALIGRLTLLPLQEVGRRYCTTADLV